MTIHNSVLELIGNTPMLKAQRLDTGLCELYLNFVSNAPHHIRAPAHVLAAHPVETGAR